MTRPLGYSVERQDDGRIALVHMSSCWTCNSDGKIVDRKGYRLTCPSGHNHTRPRPPDGRMPCPTCRESYGPDRYDVIDLGSTTSVCYDCGRDEAPPLVVAMAEANEAEALGALQPGTYPIARGFGIEVREGFSDGGRP